MRVQAASYDHKPALLGVSSSYKFSSSLIDFVLFVYLDL